MKRLLLVDDDRTSLSALELELRKTEYRLSTARDRKAALRQLGNDVFDLVICDLMLPERSDGLHIIQKAKQQDYMPAVLGITGYETVENAVEVMKAGADDFIAKGFKRGELAIRVERMLNQRDRSERLEAENKLLRERVKRDFGGYGIVGESTAIKNVLRTIEKVARDPQASCLIQGETGTGKELVAHNIHVMSPRKNQPFIPVDCAAIPKDLMESELFGHEKGAFTGASQRKKGKFELAHGGILFLDEICELDPDLQAKMLRALEEKEFFRVGGTHPVTVDVMIVSATNKDLKREVDQGHFREDLFYRLSAITIDIPPFRERPEDIEPIARYLLDQLNTVHSKQMSLDTSASEVLKSYAFPGNGRELRNMLERAVMLSETDVIEASDLPADLRSEQHPQSGAGTLNDRLAQHEREIIVEALQRNNWVKSRAADELAIDRSVLHRKMKRLKINKKG